MGFGGDGEGVEVVEDDGEVRGGGEGMRFLS